MRWVVEKNKVTRSNSLERLRREKSKEGGQFRDPSRNETGDEKGTNCVAHFADSHSGGWEGRKVGKKFSQSEGWGRTRGETDRWRRLTGKKRRERGQLALSLKMKRRKDSLHPGQFSPPSPFAARAAPGSAIGCMSQSSSAPETDEASLDLDDPFPFLLAAAARAPPPPSRVPPKPLSASGRRRDELTSSPSGLLRKASSSWSPPSIWMI